LDRRSHIPNGTTLKNYRYYIRRVWEIIDREEKQRAQIGEA